MSEEEFDLDSGSSSGEEADLTDDNENEANKPEAAEKTPETREELVRQKVEARFQDARGKKLYLRFPSPLPSDPKQCRAKVLLLSPLIKEVHRPRQPSARFCLVDFENQADRDQALLEITKSVKANVENFKGVVVALTRHDSEDFVEKCIERKIQTLENKRAKWRLKKASAAAERSKNFTSTILVHNVPKATSALELRSLFPDAVDVKLRRQKAAITLPTTMEARQALKKEVSLNGLRLKLSFAKSDKKKWKKNKNNAIKKQKKNAEQSEELVEGKPEQQKKQKRKAGESEEQVPKKLIKPKSAEKANKQKKKAESEEQVPKKKKQQLVANGVSKILVKPKSEGMANKKKQKIKAGESEEPVVKKQQKLLVAKQQSNGVSKKLVEPKSEGMANKKKNKAESEELVAKKQKKQVVTNGVSKKLIKPKATKSVDIINKKKKQPPVLNAEVPQPKQIKKKKQVSEAPKKPLKKNIKKKKTTSTTD